MNHQDHKTINGRIVSPEIDSENERRRFAGPRLFEGMKELRPADHLRTDIEITQELAERIASTNETTNYSIPTKRNPNGLISEAVLFKIQNVREAFMAQADERNWHDPETFLCVRLPYPHIILSYDHQFKKFNDIKNDKVPGIERHVNVSMKRCNRKRVEEVLLKYALSKEDTANVLHIIDRREPDSFLECELYIDGHKYPGTYFLMLDETGHVLTDKVHDQNYLWLRDGTDTMKLEKIITADGIPEDQIDLFGRHGMICLTALQFLNCKNVEIIDNPPSRQQRRHAEREGKKPPVTYKTLVIHPMGRKRTPARGPDGRATSIALHIVRGHLKDYRDGAGLGRGHAKGIYWWDSQVRGSAEHGRVEKDYEVSP